jgi:hypothetical protein
MDGIMEQDKNRVYGELPKWEKKSVKTAIKKRLYLVRKKRHVSPSYEAGAGFQGCDQLTFVQLLQFAISSKFF